MFCPAFQWMYLWAWSFSVKKPKYHLLPSLSVPMAPGNVITCSCVFIWELECDPLILLGDFPLWRWGSVALNTSGSYYPVAGQGARENTGMLILNGRVGQLPSPLVWQWVTLALGTFLMASGTAGRRSAIIMPFQCCGFPNKLSLIKGSLTFKKKQFTWASFFETALPGSASWLCHFLQKLSRLQYYYQGQLPVVCWSIGPCYCVYCLCFSCNLFNCKFILYFSFFKVTNHKRKAN